MHPVLKFGVEIAIAEAIIIVILIIASIVASILSYISENIENKRMRKIEYILLKLLQKHKKFNKKLFPKKFHNVRLLLKTILAFDAQRPPHPWHELRAEMLEQLVLPLARKKIKSISAITQIYATAAFVLKTDTKDVPSLEKIQYKKSPLAYLNCCIAGINFGIKSIVISLIKLLSSTSWLYQTGYSFLFHGAPKATHHIVAELLAQTEDVSIRATCYDIMLQFPPIKIKIDVMRDINSDDLTLKLSALKYIAYVDREAAIPLLIKQLASDIYQVRLVSIHRLYLLDAKEAVQSIAQCLNDEDLSVRRSAAKAIIHLDKDGKEIVRSIAPDLNLELANMKYVADMIW